MAHTSQALGRTECATGTDTLITYARKCQAAMKGVAIQNFNCDDLVGAPGTGEGGGTELGGQGLSVENGGPSATCNAPNVLLGVCDPGSKFHMLHRGGPDFSNDGIYIAAHCRKQGLASGRFGDIAIIAYNQNTGDTCFFQALTDLSGDVKSLALGTGAALLAHEGGEETVGGEPVGRAPRGPPGRSSRLAASHREILRLESRGLAFG